jgi:hypothetical protein
MFRLDLLSKRQRASREETKNHSLLVITPFKFCVLTFEPIEIQTHSATQNDLLNLSILKDIYVTPGPSNLEKVVDPGVHCTIPGAV